MGTTTRQEALDRYWIGRMFRRVKLANIAPQPGGVIDPYIGKCRGCGRYLNRSECGRAILPGQPGAPSSACYTCGSCGDAVDEDEPPF